MKFFISECVHVVGRLTNAHKMARTLTLLLLAVFLNSFMARAGIDPWTKEDNSITWGWYYPNAWNAVSYNSCNRMAWSSTQNIGWFDGYGFYGTSFSGWSRREPSKLVIKSLYKHVEIVPSYTRMRLNYNFKLATSSASLNQAVALYASNNLEALKSTDVDNTESYTNGSGSAYHLAHMWNGQGTYESDLLGSCFDFDNRSSSSANYITWNLLLNQVIGNNNGVEIGMGNWVGFETVGYNWTYYYYKHITFNANGGSGSMSQQTIENSGNLNACSMTRNGYVFVGWNTQKDGSGTFYADQASITANSSSKGPMTLYAQWLSIAKNLTGEFRQEDYKVKLLWKTAQGQPGNGKFVIYRNNTRVGTVSHTFQNNATADLSFEENIKNITFPYESNVTYDVYLVPNGWSEDTKRADAKASVTVNTTRHVPVNTPNAVPKEDRIIFTWTSNRYDASMGHRFYIYVDNETTPIDTIIPLVDQVSFRWEHRTTDKHSSRKNGVDNGVHYTEEPLNACSPHTYRIEGAIGTKKLDSREFKSTAIGNGTLFYSFDATKGAYPGTVKLQWHVNRQGSTDAKTYVIERRRAERENEDWATITRMSSAEDYLIYTDDTPLPGVFYDYRVTVIDKCEDGIEKKAFADDIGFAQTTGTMSGRITFGSTGSSVANVNVEARLTGTSGEDNTQYRAMRFTDPIGEVTWNYPSSTYAAGKFATNDFSMQMWVNPETLDEAKIVRLNGETCYIGMNSEGKLTLDRGKTFTSYTSIAGTGNWSEADNYKRLVDNNNISKWCCELGGGIYVEFNTSNAIIPTGYVLTTGDDTKTYPNRNPTEWKLYGKLNEGDKWTLLDSIANYTSLPATNLTDVNFNFSNSQPYKYFRFEVKAVKGYEGTTTNYLFQLQEMKLRGSDHVYTFDNTVLKAGQYNHVVLTRSGQTVTASVVGTDEAGAPVLNSSTQNIDGDWTVSGATQLSLGHFVGHVDEFRIWSKALNDTEILENYDHLLVGNENNLETYWTFDEGLSKQFFDYSRDGTVYRQHHGKTGSNAGPSNLTPAQLKLRAKTDADGNYIIQGVPFRGEGTTYAVVPTLGIHQFNPTQQLRFVGNNSLVHNGTDFTDISSFPVRGTIRYANTDYPVEGVQFYVDGQICAKEGEPITTNVNGEYEISVPIGQHYITVAKQGHEFANDGRYPADPQKTGTLVNYNDAVKNLDFEDITLVTVAGRVTGGKIEEQKPLGFGQSVNNIGQATITLCIDGKYGLNVVRNVQGTTVSYDSNPDNLPVSSPTADVQSIAYRQGGNSDDVQKIVIKTDPATGEFAALLPPIDYRVESIDIENNQQITFDNLPVLYANDPTKTQTDSLAVEGSHTKSFEYVAKMIMSYYTDPHLEITQEGHTDGSFGEQTYTYSDKLTPDTELPLYTVEENGDITYTYGYPFFKQQNTYKFNVRGYETYVNKDGESPVSYEVPLRDVEVTFSNQMGSGQQVVINPELTDEDDERGDLGSTAPDMVTLDEDGKAQYEWTAGLPNITAPYTLSLAATFVQNDRTYTWNGINATNSLAGVVTGALPSGTNFVTKGPDQVTMILRDPAGSASQAYWEAGNTVTSTVTTEQSLGNEAETMTHTEIGFELTQFNGVGVGAISGIITNTKEVVTVDLGVTTEVTGVDANTKSISVTNNKRVSTSDQPEYVGAQGDVFIGNSTNILFGNARCVGLKKEAEGFALAATDNYVTGTEFGTTFNYTQNFIENVMIPNFVAMRNKFLTKGFDEAGLTYESSVDAEADNFGAEGTYTCGIPSDSEIYTDSVAYYNQQIANWENLLAYNEQMKVLAIDNRRTYIDSNQSFDSGTFIESSTTYTASVNSSYTASFEAHMVFGSGTDFEIFGNDVNVNVQSTTSFGNSRTDEWGHERTVTTGYTLMETGDDDALTVDVYKAPDGLGAIFVTRGGQTSCPYEGEQKTKYFEPGKHTISTATMQIEKPRIAVENGANRVGGVPAGKMANFTLLLTNESETGEDCYFDLFVIDETNVNGAGIDINSNEIGSGRSVLVPAGGTVRMNLALEQNLKGDLLYENIAVVLASQCQKDPASTWDVIGDTVYISAEFVPSSTDVALRIDNAVVNTSTKGVLPLTVSGYDPQYNGLKYISVQYQGVGESAWHDARRYMVNEGDILNPIDEPLPKNGIINLNFDMTNGTVFPDRTYKFRALSARTYGSGEVTNVSQEITVVKDMNRPKPLGQPQPTDGILSAGDELSVLFNEAILSGELSKDQNFRVTGVLNGSVVDHQTALSVVGGSDATAATEANINLSGKDFSIDTWVNVQSAGTLLSHGTGTQKLAVGVNDDNKLVVKIGDQTYTSLNDVPQNQWSFLTLSLTQDGKLSASVATDATTTTLFKDKEVTTYEGNGPLAVGQQMTAAMHELLLWEEARDITTALQQRSVTKSPATRGLIGYWKMNEGEGMTLTDYARNRHMTMAAETWHIENENKAVALDGDHYVYINTSEIPPMPQDDYAVELWMKAGEQTADAQLLQLGEIGLSLNTDGQLQLESNNSSLFTLHSSLTDNAWHHVALSVLRNGNANIYVDGVSRATVSADKIGSLGSDQLLIGARRTLMDVQNNEVLYQYDRSLTGIVDEVRVWNATMNADQLKKQRKVRLTGDEPGLVAYYPFEVKTLDSQNQVITNGDAADLCGSGNEAQLSTLHSELCTIDYTDVAPALRVKPEEENVSFTFTASENKIVIELNEEPAKVEGCTLNFTVRNVHDQNNNLSEPVSWSAFVNQNPLKWQEPELALTQQVTEESTLTATLVNKSGKQQTWTMEALPAWLKADIEYGNLQPLAEQAITFTVSSATPIGKYEQTVYVSGNDGIETPLTLNISVTGNVPEWAVNPHDYEESMNVIAVLKKDGKPMIDTDDMLAAFVGEECRGLAHPKYNERYGNYYLTMDIYGQSNDCGKEVTFRAYDASTGAIYPVVTLESESVFAFLPLTLMGTYAEPKVFNVQDKIEQVTELKAGWNFVSFYVKADDMTIPELFKGIAEDVVTVKSHRSGYISYENGLWGGNLTNNLSNTEMYAVKMKADRKLRIVGSSVHTPVTVYSGWNWIGYQGGQVASLGDALADMTKNDGDMVKALRGIAYWDDFEWSGSLQIMEPGQGYQMKNTGSNQTFCYPNTVVAGTRHLAPAQAPSMEKDMHSAFDVVDARNYPDNAIMAAKVVAGAKKLAGVELAAFAGTECRSAAVTNEQGVAFLTIPGDEPCELTFKMSIAGEMVDVPLILTYETNAIYGTPMNPVVIDMANQATCISGLTPALTEGSVYDLSGRKMNNEKQLKGVYIVNGQKKIVK